ncbi:MAG: Trk family potassium uptake protein [Ruminococcaceae bacterium]|nr:Trk family potassium uptake protein [Oscillospiraceae bacterium]
MKSFNKSLTYPKITAVSFALLILAGTGLLMLPISSKTSSASFVDALFTATSAGCITGLVPFDTFTQWSVFGQIVIISLIQIGGLGFVTILSGIVRMLGQKMSLKQKMMLKESIGSLTLGDATELVKSVVVFTLLCEAAGAALLSIRFVPLAGLRRGVYMAIFTSVSAYCNAGFDLMGQYSPSSSLTTINGDWVVLLTISMLIIFGGLGFIVWEDMRYCKFRPSAFSVHTKLTLITTAALLLGSTALFLFFENGNTLSDMGIGKKLLNAFFSSVTPRTAGFNSVDVGAMTPLSKMLTIILMFIGGSTGSTAGGIKTTTVAVIVLCVVSNMRDKDDVNVFGRRITLDTIKKSISVIATNLFLIFIATVIVSNVQPEASLIDVIFECTSAIGTVGMTAGITTSLCVAAKIVIILLMYVGRLTSLIFALSFVQTKPKTNSHKPRGYIMVG